jgi:short-subunit dehydrogenase
VPTLSIWHKSRIDHIVTKEKMMRFSTLLATTGLTLLYRKIHSHLQGRHYLHKKVILITGGSKGLGLALARQLVEEHCHIALCARDEHELKKAQKDIDVKHSTISLHPCDVADFQQVEGMVKDIENRFGHIDLLINNAGIIMVGPMETFNHDDYEKAMDVMYWGIVNTTMAVLPLMKLRSQGHIVNITSVGGKVSIPHLLPYSASKFAAIGFSEGCSAELRKNNITVATIIPGLMRTGSYVNALFQKDNQKEFKLFSILSTAPLLTVSAQDAAKSIINAIKDKKTRKIIGFQAWLLIEMNHFFPRLTMKAFAKITRHLPGEERKVNLVKGEDLKKELRSEITMLNKREQQIQKENQLRE